MIDLATGPHPDLAQTSHTGLRRRPQGVTMQPFESVVQHVLDESEGMSLTLAAAVGGAAAR